MIDSEKLDDLATAILKLQAEFPKVEFSCVVAFPIEEPEEAEVIGYMWDGEEFLEYEFDPMENEP